MKNLCLLTSLLVTACGSTSPPPVPTMTHNEPPVESHNAGVEPVVTAPNPPAEPAVPDPEQAKADLLAAETAAYATARPVFEKYCASCHKQGEKNATKKKLEHFDMTTYPFGGHHAAEVSKEIREALGIVGSKPTMPKNKPGSVTSDELTLIAAWADAFDAAHPGGVHEGHDGHHGHHH